MRAAQQLEPAPHEDQVGVVGDVRARRAEVDERLRRRRDVAERVDVRHHVVAEAPLVRGDGVEVDVVEVRAHLRERLVGNRNAELAARASASASQSRRQRP